MAGIRGKFVPDIRDVSMAGVKSYAGRIKAQYVNHLSQYVSGMGIRRVFTARVVCSWKASIPKWQQSGKGDSGEWGSDCDWNAGSDGSRNWESSQGLDWRSVSA